MKIIITESKLKDLRTSYLNYFHNHASVSKFDSFIVVYYNETDDDNDDSIAMEYDSDDGRLYLDKNFTLFFKNYFPNEDDVIPFIKDWFENEFGVKIKYIQS
jgi:hypothetical protein